MKHPTIRQISASAQGSELQQLHFVAAKTALLVIDFQKEYFSGMLPVPDAHAALTNARRLIQFADDHGILVVHIQHVFPSGSPIFATDRQGVEIHQDIQPKVNHQLIQKSAVSAFVGTDLDLRLKQHGIEKLIVTGLMTHACVTGAIRDAVPLGYQTIVVEDACATRSLEQESRFFIEHHTLHTAAIAALADIFASVATTDEILRYSCY